MGRFLVLIFIALITFLLILLVTRPELINEVWLYVIGLIGLIGKLFERVFRKIKEIFTEDQSQENTKPLQGAVLPRQADKNSSISTLSAASLPVAGATGFDGMTLTLLRYYDDGQTTVGLLYVDSQYFCMTLEDTYHEVRIPRETRIPAGMYNVKFREDDSPKTLEYRSKYPWFSFHLELQDVPGFQYIYIHAGGYATDTDGCILVSDSINIADAQTYLTNSRKTFQRLYERISAALKAGKKVQMIIRDENWFGMPKVA